MSCLFERVTQPTSVQPMLFGSELFQPSTVFHLSPSRIGSAVTDVTIFLNRSEAFVENRDSFHAGRRRARACSVFRWG